MAVVKWMSWLVLASSAVLVSGIYVDESLLYDTFPAGFIWASATSAHQIEGAWNVDGKGPSIWDTYTSQPGIVAEGATGQTACNSYYFYQKDVDALARLNVSHYRFSISWPRVLPNGTGQVNQLGVNYYKNLIAALKAANIQPMVTLYHWDLPQALEDMGGWLNPAVADWFVEYARLCFTEFGSDVKIWVTLNEPWITAWQGYGLGVSAPAKYGPGTFTYQAGHNLILAHAKVYRLYEASFKPTQQGKVGIALNINWYLPARDLIADADAAERALQFMGGWFANPIFGTGDYPSIMKLKIADKSAQQGFNQSRLPEFTPEEKTLVQGSADFLGINHYTSSLTENRPSNISDVSYEADQDVYSYYDPTWYGSGSPWLKITPFGLRKLLSWLKAKFNDPEIVITENGSSDTAGNLDDMGRIYYYKHYINNVLKAIKIDGVRVTGYTAWSLMDNFEWRAGYTEKFGIFNVNFTSPDLPRTPKASANYYAQIIRDNGFKSDQACNNYPIAV